MTIKAINCVSKLEWSKIALLHFKQLKAQLLILFCGFEVVVVDEAPGARPGLTNPLVQDFVAALGLDVSAKYGWTDVARFGEWGIPALNYGPGDPSLAHSDDEQVDIAQIEACYRALKSWLSPQ